MVEGADKYASVGAASRSSINREDKSWQAQGVDVAAKIAEVAAKDARVGLQLALQAAFGLRAREAMQLRPHVADKGAYLALNVGTKGGRDREAVKVFPCSSPAPKTKPAGQAKAPVGMACPVGTA
jgi:hypothetical protein